MGGIGGGRSDRPPPPSGAPVRTGRARPLTPHRIHGARTPVRPPLPRAPVAPPPPVPGACRPLRARHAPARRPPPHPCPGSAS
ncbi:hypothetical protein CLM82_23725, partial [Streptomyces albidoflavus]